MLKEITEHRLKEAAMKAEIDNLDQQLADM
jgi:hypothetical protein